MAILVYKDATLYLAQYDLSADLNSLTLRTNRAALDKTTFGQTTRVNKGGLYEIGVDATGFTQSDSADPQSEDILSANLGADGAVATVTPAGAADGDRCWLAQMLETEFSPFSNGVGDLTAFSVRAVGAGRWARGTIMLPKAAYTTTGNGSGVQLGAITAGQRMHAAMHVFSASAGDTLDVIVTSDDGAGFSTPTTRLTFTQVSGGSATSEFLQTDGSAITDDYWRVQYTIAGDGGESFTFAVALGIL